MRTEDKFLAAAVILGPLSIYPALVIPAMARLYLVSGEAFTPLDDLVGSVAIATVALIPGYILTVFFGLPAFFLLRRFNRLSLLNIVGVSLAPAAIAATTFSIDPSATFLVYGYFSVVVGVSCWVVAVWLPRAGSNTRVYPTHKS